MTAEFNQQLSRLLVHPDLQDLICRPGSEAIAQGPLEHPDPTAISRSTRLYAQAPPSTASEASRTTAPAPSKCLAGAGAGHPVGGVAGRSVIVNRRARSPSRRAE